MAKRITVTIPAGSKLDGLSAEEIEKFVKEHAAIAHSGLTTGVTEVVLHQERPAGVHGLVGGIEWSRGCGG